MGMFAAPGMGSNVTGPGSGKASAPSSSGSNGSLNSMDSLYFEARAKLTRKTV